MVQEGRGGYVEHFPKIWCRGMKCEVRKTKFSEGDRKRKWMEQQIRQKKVLEKEKKIGQVGARGVRPLRPSHSSLRPALWTISTSGKVLDA
jgi:hypothetical protein